MNKRITAISEEYMAALVQHSWPGNVRELQNLIERSVILSTSDMLSGSLPERAHTAQDDSKWSKPSTPVTLLDAQRSHILETLHQTKGVVGGRNGAAARLGLRRTTLINKMKRLGINRQQSSAFRVRAAAAWRRPARNQEPAPRRADWLQALSAVVQKAEPARAWQSVPRTRRSGRLRLRPARSS